jgi:hypothetical protein
VLTAILEVKSIPANPPDWNTADAVVPDPLRRSWEPSEELALLPITTLLSVDWYLKSMKPPPLDELIFLSNNNVISSCIVIGEHPYIFVSCEL